MDKNNVIKYLRGLINSSPTPLTLKLLDRDYKTLEGEKIPYSKLGYKSLEEFVRSVPTLKLIKTSNGETIVRAEVIPESAHIVDMVKKQKPPKVKRSRFSKAVLPKNWRPNNSHRYANKHFTSPRVAAVSHNQFVDYKQPKVASKIVIPEHSTFAPTKNLPPRLQKVSQSSRLQINQTHENDASNEVFTKFNTGFVTNTLREIRKSSLEEEYNSSGSSRRKMITRMMSEVSLDRDSGNSSPVSDITPPPVNVPEFVTTNDPKVDLANLVEFHKLGEIQVSTKSVNCKRLKMYTCKITIGSHNFNSYPEEFPNPQAAELYCYKQALGELTAKYGNSRNLFLATDNDILKRIPDMLKKHNSGIWEWQLQFDYAQRYNEKLPQDWLKIIDRSPFIHLQKIVNNYTLKYCRPEDVFQKGMDAVKAMTLTDVSVPANTVRLDDNHKTCCQITFIPSANEVWCRQIDTEETDAHSEMITKMEEYYENNRENYHAININLNGYYVANLKKKWYRIRAIEVNDLTVKCFYIDYGDEITLPKEHIYQLKREFAFCEAQAFVCRLAGLEDLYEISQESKALQECMYKPIEIELAEETIEPENEILPVYMYDLNSDSCINIDIMMLLDQEFATPTIGDNITEVRVSHIAKNGDLYLQVQGHGNQRLLQLLADLEYQIVSEPPTHLLQRLTKENSKGQLYLGKYSVDGHWYRVKILDWSPGEDFMQIYYVDFGNSEVVKAKEALLYPLEKLNVVISKYPHQAIRTRMFLEYTPNDLHSELVKVVPMNEPIIAKVTGTTDDNDRLPLVEFFSRTSKGGLFCINKSITVTNEVKKVDVSSKSIKKVQFSTEGSKHVPSGGMLECPPLPEKKTYFGVHVPLAVNPYNFFVQLLDSRPKLHKMMEQLQERYKDVTYSPLTLDQIRPGNIYASRYDDGNWYRTTVIKVIHDGSISVFYCDFGYYINLTLQELIPLDVEFLKLPYQALKAKLSGIKPKDSNWTVEHCDKFKELVERKNLVSVIKNIEKDQLYDSDLVLDLLLVDTSADEDVYIDQYLISKGIAVEA